MDKYKLLILKAHKEYIERYIKCNCFYGRNAYKRLLLPMTHFYMIHISYDMLLDGLY